MVPTLPDRAAYAQKTSLGALDLLELALQDEIDRRENKNLSTRLDRAGFDESHTFEDFDWDAPVTFDRDRVRDYKIMVDQNLSEMKEIIRQLLA